MRTIMKSIAGAILLAAGTAHAAQPTGVRWIATWATSPTGLPDSERLRQWNEVNPTRIWQASTVVRGTIRYRVRIATGGKSLRLVISNAYRQAPLKLGG